VHGDLGPVAGRRPTASWTRPGRRVTGRWLRRFGRTTTRLSPLWRISIDGQVPDDISHRAYVVVANHQSNLDPFLLSHLPWDMRWIAKQELFRIPVIGSLLRLLGDIPLRRGDSESVRRMVAECRETLDRGLSVMMFATRARSLKVRRMPRGVNFFSSPMRCATVTNAFLRKLSERKPPSSAGDTSSDAFCSGVMSCVSTCQRRTSMTSGGTEMRCRSRSSSSS